MVRPIARLSLQLPEPEISRVLSQCDPVANGIDLSLLEDEPVPRSFQAHRPVLDEAWPAHLLALHVMTQNKTFAYLWN